jgi:hypothetical protein
MAQTKAKAHSQGTETGKQWVLASTCRHTYQFSAEIFGVLAKFEP